MYSNPLEIWAGIECTCNRVGDDYFDQLESSGHTRRLDDLERIADLGIRTIRYPVLWERHEVEAGGRCDWTWADERLGHMQRLGLTPIAGLVHHGSGPPHTSLLDPQFGEKLAAYAVQVARRYPWLSMYTPVNEPLTTARFSALYGYWHPHAEDDVSFARAVLNQCRGIVLAMRAIRSVSPEARLIQTEDIAWIHSTPLLAYQADFENQRRWLTYDVLCGLFRPGHAMYEFFRWAGVAMDEMDWFAENTCPPDIIGINYYITSERFLDERVELYPECFHGGNGQHEYADVETVRACPGGLAGPDRVIRETWNRYRLPLAVTEVHLGCTREEQLRWLYEIWQTAKQARGQGIDIRAVTAWSAFGSYDWKHLMTRADGHYEPGVFDLRSPSPRPTALAGMLKQLAAGEEPYHPVLAVPGWWRRSERILYGPDACLKSRRPTRLPEHSRTILISGGQSKLAFAFGRFCHLRGLKHTLVDRRQMDVADASAVEAVIASCRPWAIINTAGFACLESAEEDAELCIRENTRGAIVLAEACARHGIRLVTFSRELVFDGAATQPYVESDAVRPLNVLGRSKAEAEAGVLGILPSAMIVRTCEMFDAADESSSLNMMMRSLAAGESCRAISDVLFSPTHMPDMVQACLDLLVDKEEGLWHLATPGAVSWADLARQAGRLIGLKNLHLQECQVCAVFPRVAHPRYTVLGSERGWLLPSLDEALDRYAFDWRKRNL